MPKTIREWINEVLTESESEWVIAVFKLNGGFMDGSGRSRQSINEMSLPRVLKSLDWTITTTRRKLGSKSMRFVPFIGGDEKTGVNTHIHSIIEIPPHSNIYELSDTLNRYWSEYSAKSVQGDIKSEVWINPMDLDKSRNHLYYVTRFEGDSYSFGDEKVLIQCKSFLLN